MDIHKQNHYHKCTLKDIQAAVRLGAIPMVDDEGSIANFVYTDEERIGNVCFESTWYFHHGERDAIKAWIRSEVL